MLNFILLVIALCITAFLFSIYFQLSRIESSLNKMLEDIEGYLLRVYGEE